MRGRGPGRSGRAAAARATPTGMPTSARSRPTVRPRTSCTRAGSLRCARSASCMASTTAERCQPVATSRCAPSAVAASWRCRRSSYDTGTSVNGTRLERRRGIAAYRVSSSADGWLAPPMRTRATSVRSSGRRQELHRRRTPWCAMARRRLRSAAPRERYTSRQVGSRVCGCIVRRREHVDDPAVGMEVPGLAVQDRRRGDGRAHGSLDAVTVEMRGRSPRCGLLRFCSWRLLASWWCQAVTAVAEDHGLATTSSIAGLGGSAARLDARLPPVPALAYGPPATAVPFSVITAVCWNDVTGSCSRRARSSSTQPWDATPGVR